MKPQFFLIKLYWLVVAAVPFYPWYELTQLQNELTCAYGTACFESALTFSVKGSVAGITTGIVLWPLCLWKLFGSHLWYYFKKPNEKA